MEWLHAVLTGQSWLSDFICVKSHSESLKCGVVATDATRHFISDQSDTMDHKRSFVSTKRQLHNGRNFKATVTFCMLNSLLCWNGSVVTIATPVVPDCPRKVDSYAADQSNIHAYGSPRFITVLKKSPPPETILSHLNLISIFTLCISKANFNDQFICLHSTYRISVLSTQVFWYFMPFLIYFVRSTHWKYQV